MTLRKERVEHDLMGVPVSITLEPARAEILIPIRRQLCLFCSRHGNAHAIAIIEGAGRTCNEYICLIYDRGYLLFLY